MRIIARLFRKPPQGFDRPIDMRYDHPLNFETLPPLAYHVFVFDLDGALREVWVKEGEATPRYARGRTYRAYLDAEGSYAWFDGRKQVVRVRATDEEADAKKAGAASCDPT